jgi:hypothetical protein
MLDLSDLTSFAELAEAPLEAFRAQLHWQHSLLGLPCDRSRVAMLWAHPWPRPP